MGPGFRIPDTRTRRDRGDEVARVSDPYGANMAGIGIARHDDFSSPRHRLFAPRHLKDASASFLNRRYRSYGRGRLGVACSIKSQPHYL